MKIVGLGYVGDPLASAFADASQSVIGYGIDEEKITSLRRTQRATTTTDEANASSTLTTLKYGDGSLTGLEPSTSPHLSVLRSAARTIGEQLTPLSSVSTFSSSDRSPRDEFPFRRYSFRYPFDSSAFTRRGRTRTRRIGSFGVTATE